MGQKYCVIMAGGIGSRFWPLSREDQPKQFLDILGTGKSFLRQTYERFLPVVKPENILIVTNERYKDLVMDQIPELAESQVLLEPMRRNTAPCIAYAMHKIKAICDDATMIVTPADHFITNEANFCKVITESCEYAEKNGALMTIGITPTRPETGYGYIQKMEDSCEGNTYKVKTFTEKPNRELAEIFLGSGEFLWNSGIFVWTEKSISKAFASLLPEMETLFEEGKVFYNTAEERTMINKIFSKCVNISIDYGIMEHSKNVYVSVGNFGWSDVGTWSSLYEHSQKDVDGNSCNNHSVHIFNTSNSIINIPKNKRAVIQGLSEYIIVDTDSTLLICQRDKEDEIKVYADVCENS